MSELLAPAVSYAENGFPMDHVNQDMWQTMHSRLKRLPGGRYFLNRDNSLPPLGQIMVNRPLARLFKASSLFYRVCAAIGEQDLGFNETARSAFARGHGIALSPVEVGYNLCSLSGASESRYSEVAHYRNQYYTGTSQRLGHEGPEVVYKGCVAEGIVDAVRRAGGVLSIEDLSDHMESTEPLETEPASTTYRGEVAVHTTTLPTQGAVLLEALNILNRFDLKEIKHIPGQYEHFVIEALRHALADGLRHVGDPRTGGSLHEMLSHQRAHNNAAMVKFDRKMEAVCPEAALSIENSGTTFVAAADEAGSVCGLIGSLSEYFGCAVVEEHGFALQRRGAAFNRVSGHPNCFGPRKKPYHSLMPVMVTDARSGDWLCTMGTMGGLIQTSVLAQVLLNMVELGLDPQQSLSKPRFLVGSARRMHPDSPLVLEPNFPQEAQTTLRRRGHTLSVDHDNRRSRYAGHANILARATHWWSKEQVHHQPNPNGSIWCGAEPRTKSVALGF